MDQIILHPFFGFGITGFGFIDGQYFRTLIELGILGLAAFVILLASVHHQIRKCMHANLPSRLEGMVVGLYAGFWGLLTHAITANTFIIVRISEPFWCLMGLSIAASMAVQLQNEPAMKILSADSDLNAAANFPE
jgi:hypothetical protein